MKKHILLICLIDCALFLLKFVKDNAKVGAMIVGLGVGAYFVDKNMSKAYAGNINILNNSPNVSGSIMNCKHIQGATEGYDNYGIDIEWLNSPNPLQIYSNNINCLPTTDKLSTEAKDINSTIPFNYELYTNGGFTSADNYFKFVMINNNNFEWKNIFLGDANDSNDIVADVKYQIYSSGLFNGSGQPYGFFNLPDVTGNPARVYDKRKIPIFNHADLNRDRRVNGLDYAIFANNWGRTGIVKGSNPNDANDYADIQDIYDVNGVMVSYGDEVVDGNDLGEFVYEWLWDANDPQSW